MNKALFLLGLSLAVSQPLTSAASTPDFEREIAPILVTHCLDCHQPTKRSGELNLSTREGLLAGGEQGRAIAIDKPGTSLLL